MNNNELVAVMTVRRKWEWAKTIILMTEDGEPIEVVIEVETRDVS